MKNTNDLARRQFLKSAGVLGSLSMLRVSGGTLAAVAQAACSARDESQSFQLLGADEARSIAAIAARIIPSTDTPGATEAGVVYFFDAALGKSMSGLLDPVRHGLAKLSTAVATQQGARTTFAELDAEQQDEILRGIEDSEFFSIMRDLTIFGFFAMEHYGGNRQHVSWKLIGFDGHNGAWEYPFGYYDAEASRDSGGDSGRE